MKLDFSDIYKYADFKEGEKPKLKDEYWKTYYAVVELRKDWVDKCSYNMKGSLDGTVYKQGYYVIPVMIWPQNWVRKKGIFIYGRKFVTCLGYTIEGEPHDVPREHWKDCEKFKYYWGVGEHMNDHATMDAEDTEIYDNINEAIARAKVLDQLLPVLYKIGKSSCQLESRKYHLEEINDKLERNNYKNELYRKLDKTKKEIYTKEIVKLENKIKMLEKSKQKLGAAYNNRNYEDYIRSAIIEYRLRDVGHMCDCMY